MLLKLKPAPLDLKDFVGQTIFAIGQGSEWRRGKPLQENVQEFTVVSCAIKYAQLKSPTSINTYRVERRPSRKGSHDVGFQYGSLLVFASKEEIDAYIKATENGTKILDALQYSASTNMQPSIINAMYDAAIKAGWEPK